MATKMFAKFIPIFCDASDFKWHFLDPFELDDDSLNGLTISNIYIPEELLTDIFSYLSPQEILTCSLVCKKWHNIAKSNVLWQRLYARRVHRKKTKNLPWYVFYCYLTTNNFLNLVKNGNGEEGLTHWTVKHNGGDGFVIENPPNGSDPLPVGVPEFHGQLSCFATSYHACAKFQKFDLKFKKLLRYIIRKYRPSLYASEWFSGRYDCGSVYKLGVFVDTLEDRFEFPSRGMRPFQFTKHSRLEVRNVTQWEGHEWQKVEVIYDNYPIDALAVTFYHEGQDTQFWKGHYGAKMAGGVLKFVFDSIEPHDEEKGGGDGDNKTVI